jgi:hypothetical protein
MPKDLESLDKSILAFRPKIEFVEPPLEDGEITPVSENKLPVEEVVLRNQGLRNYADAIDKLAAAIQAKADKKAKDVVIALDPNIDKDTIMAMQRRFPDANPNEITYAQYRTCKDDLRNLGRQVSEQLAVTPDKVSAERSNAIQALLDKNKTRPGQVAAEVAAPETATRAVDANIAAEGALGDETGLPAVLGPGPVPVDLLAGLTAKELAALGITGGEGGISGGANIGNTDPGLIDNPESPGAAAGQAGFTDSTGGAPAIDPNTGLPSAIDAPVAKDDGLPPRSAGPKFILGGFNNPDAKRGGNRPELDTDLFIIKPIDMNELEPNMLCILVNALWQQFIWKKLKTLPVVGELIEKWKRLCNPGLDFDLPGLQLLGDPPNLPTPPEVPKKFFER